MDNNELLRQIIQSAIKYARQIADDTEALNVKFLYKEFEKQIGRTLDVGEYIQYNDKLYKVLQAHTVQENWAPDVAPSLFAEVLTDPTGQTILEWKQPDSTNPYMTGDKVKYEGVIYESLINNNVWSPAAYPAGWKKIG